MKQTGYACALGAGTIINAIATWKGAAFGIDLRTEAEVTLTDSKKIQGYIETLRHLEDGPELRIIQVRLERTILPRIGELHI